MTDVSNLDNLAAAIASSSAKIRSYAVAQAAATQSQEADFQAKIAALDARLDVLEGGSPPPPPPPTPPTGQLAPPEAPRAPVSDRTNPSAEGFNVYTGPADIHDYTIHDTGDNGILVHQNGGGSTVRRVDIRRVQKIVAWATHGIYAKAPNNLFEDIRVDNTGGKATTGITIRHPNNTVRRVWLGGGFQCPITYHENSGVAGTILIEDAELHYLHWETCIYGNDDNAPPTPGLKQRFILKRVHAFGPVGAKLIRLTNYTGAGVTLEDCWINGRQATMADVEIIRL